MPRAISIYSTRLDGRDSFIPRILPRECERGHPSHSCLQTEHATREWILFQCSFIQPLAGRREIEFVQVPATKHTRRNVHRGDRNLLQQFTRVRIPLGYLSTTPHRDPEIALHI